MNLSRIDSLALDDLSDRFSFPRAPWRVALPVSVRRPAMDRPMRASCGTLWQPPQAFPSVGGSEHIAFDERSRIAIAT